MMTSEALLITASINPKKTQDLVICDSQERLVQYLTSLIAWIKLTDVRTIIFCENTNSNYDFSKIKRISEEEEKILEILTFDGNQEAQKYGKGYGEGKIIKYALENSQYLNDQTDFYKITGRLFVPGFSRFQQLHSNFSNVFRTSTAKPFELPEDHPWVLMDLKQPENIGEYIRKIAKFSYLLCIRGRRPHKYTNLASTIFYKSNVASFRKYLSNSYKRVNEKKSYSIEHIFYEDLQKMPFCEFQGKYEFWGVCAGTGESYSQQSYPQDIIDLALTLSKS